VAALIVLPFAGRAIVRRGPLPVLLAALVTAATGALGLGLASTATTVLSAAAALGAGQAVMQPALATMIVDCSTADTRSRAFATQFFLQNLGLGVGGLIGGHLVDPTSASSFTLLFAIEAAMFLLLVVVMSTVRTPHSPRIEDAPGRPGSRADKGGWRQMLDNRAMVRLSVLGFVLFFACYGQFESGLSAYGVEAAGISTSALGTALAANTAMIVIAQFAVLKFVERRRRSRVIAAVGLIWAVAWVAAGFAGLGHGSREMATAAFVSTYALFGLGEAMLSPTVAPLVADLAPEGMAGQYNSAFALVKQLALAVGPAVGGPMGASLHAPYIVTFLLFSLGITYLAVRLGRQLTAVQDQPWRARSRVVAQGGPATAGRAQSHA
jgi:MFS family permease